MLLCDYLIHCFHPLIFFQTLRFNLNLSLIGDERMVGAAILVLRERKSSLGGLESGEPIVPSPTF